ncbi:hypothetical protein B0H13DRAFT_2390539 [Mycena leptocephala]|nr:hypothetical protein B0H13DRAFT_2390539 [Mycena leptocephala]
MHRSHNVWDSPPHAWTLDAPRRHHTQSIKHEQKGRRDAPAAFPSTSVETRPNAAFAPARCAVRPPISRCGSNVHSIPSSRRAHGHESKRDASDPVCKQDGDARHSLHLILHARCLQLRRPPPSSPPSASICPAHPSHSSSPKLKRTRTERTAVLTLKFPRAS